MLFSLEAGYVRISLFFFFFFLSEPDRQKGTCVKGRMDLMKRMVFSFIYSSMLGKSFPYGESIFIHSCLLFSVCFSLKSQKKIMMMMTMM